MAAHWQARRPCSPPMSARACSGLLAAPSPGAPQPQGPQHTQQPPPQQPPSSSNLSGSHSFPSSPHPAVWLGAQLPQSWRGAHSHLAVEPRQPPHLPAAQAATPQRHTGPSARSPSTAAAAAAAAPVAVSGHPRAQTWMPHLWRQQQRQCQLPGSQRLQQPCQCLQPVTVTSTQLPHQALVQQLRNRCQSQRSSRQSKL